MGDEPIPIHPSMSCPCLLAGDCFFGPFCVWCNPIRQKTDNSQNLNNLDLKKCVRRESVWIEPSRVTAVINPALQPKHSRKLVAADPRSKYFPGRQHHEVGESHHRRGKTQNGDGVAPVKPEQIAPSTIPLDISASLPAPVRTPTPQGDSARQQADSSAELPHVKDTVSTSLGLKSAPSNMSINPLSQPDSQSPPLSTQELTKFVTPTPTPGQTSAPPTQRTPLPYSLSTVPQPSPTSPSVPLLPTPAIEPTISPTVITASIHHVKSIPVHKSIHKVSPKLKGVPPKALRAMPAYLLSTPQPSQSQPSQPQRPELDTPSVTQGTKSSPNGKGTKDEFDLNSCSEGDDGDDHTPTVTSTVTQTLNTSPTQPIQTAPVASPVDMNRDPRRGVYVKQPVASTKALPLKPQYQLSSNTPTATNTSTTNHNPSVTTSNVPTNSNLSHSNINNAPQPPSSQPIRGLLMAKRQVLAKRSEDFPTSQQLTKRQHVLVVDEIPNDFSQTTQPTNRAVNTSPISNTPLPPPPANRTVTPLSIPTPQVLTIFLNTMSARVIALSQVPPPSDLSRNLGLPYVPIKPILRSTSGTAYVPDDQRNICFDKLVSAIKQRFPIVIEGHAFAAAQDVEAYVFNSTQNQKDYHRLISLQVQTIHDAK
eukprot:c5780_g1_i2.p1 GENE.c5780_g1_i2~~c5780_g1_i2.p1  ORF type:complete len:649 (-),score=116.15 c5780_g1_i2:108-2054(-)